VEVASGSLPERRPHRFKNLSCPDGEAIAALHALRVQEHLFSHGA
jgi:hypothetical protein